MSRKDRQREGHRREILVTAEQIFARKGYQATTMEEVAKEAEFAVGTLYNLFKGKDDLYANVIDSFVQQFLAQFAEKVQSVEDAEKAIAALIQLRLAHFHEHREFIRIAFEASSSPHMDSVRHLPPKLVELHSRYTESVRDIFERGIAQGTFDQADPLYLALFLEGIINAFVGYWSRHEPTEPLSVRIAKMQREFLGRIKVRLGDSPAVDGRNVSEQTTI